MHWLSSPQQSWAAGINWGQSCSAGCLRLHFFSSPPRVAFEATPHMLLAPGWCSVSHGSEHWRGCSEKLCQPQGVCSCWGPVSKACCLVLCHFDVGKVYSETPAGWFIPLYCKTLIFSSCHLIGIISAMALAHGLYELLFSSEFIFWNHPYFAKLPETCFPVILTIFSYVKHAFYWLVTCKALCTGA